METTTQRGGRPIQATPSPYKLDADLTLAMAAAGSSAGAIVRAHAAAGVRVSRQAVARFVRRWRDADVT